MPGADGGVSAGLTAVAFQLSGKISWGTAASLEAGSRHLLLRSPVCLLPLSLRPRTTAPFTKPLCCAIPRKRMFSNSSTGRALHSPGLICSALLTGTLRAVMHFSSQYTLTLCTPPESCVSAEQAWVKGLMAGNHFIISDMYIYQSLFNGS